MSSRLAARKATVTKTAAPVRPLAKTIAALFWAAKTTSPTTATTTSSLIRTKPITNRMATELLSATREFLSPLKLMPSEKLSTSLCSEAMEKDLLANAKTFMYPTNVVSTKVVTAHQRVVMASMAAKHDPIRLRVHPEILKYTENFWAESTMANRRALWARFVKFRQQQPQAATTTMDEAVTEFVATLPDISLSTRKTYAVSLCGILRELMVPYPTLSMARKGMVAMGANTPESKATPITRDQVHFLMHKNKVRWPLLCLTFWLLWKTASRFDDVQHLTRESFLVVDENELILVFGRLKNNREGKIKMSSLVHILDRAPMTWQCRCLRALSSNEKIVPVNYQSFMRHLTTSFPDLSAHSFKHGAHEQMLRHVEALELDPDLVPYLMKHAGGNHRYSAQTIAYSSPEALKIYARQFRSGEATRLL